VLSHVKTELKLNRIFKKRFRTRLPNDDDDSVLMMMMMTSTYGTQLYIPPLYSTLGNFCYCAIICIDLLIVLPMPMLMVLVMVVYFRGLAAVLFGVQY